MQELFHSIARQGWSLCNLIRFAFKLLTNCASKQQTSDKVSASNNQKVRPQLGECFLNSTMHDSFVTSPDYKINVVKWWLALSKIGYFAESVSSQFPSLPWHRITPLSSSNNPSWCDLILNFSLPFISRCTCKLRSSNVCTGHMYLWLLIHISLSLCL